MGFDVAPAKYPTTFNKQGGQINNKKSNNMKENLGSIQSILDSFKKGGCVKKQNGGDIIDPYTKKPYSKEIVAAARARVEG